MLSPQPSLLDPEAFGNMYERTKIIIFRFIYGIHGGPVEEVEDLTCDTFLRAWRGRSRFVGDEHDALCWLFTIARRLVIDAHRRNKSRRTNSQVKLDDTNLPPAMMFSQETPEEQASSHEQFQHLWMSLQRLPDERREMLVLRYMVGWKVKEIANYLQKEENTVSVYIKRGLEQIRNELKAE